MAARRLKGLSREDVGKAIGVSGRVVTYWETWVKNPDPSHVDALAKLLCLSDVDKWRISHRPAAKVQVLPKKRRRIW